MNIGHGIVKNYWGKKKTSAEIKKSEVLEMCGVQGFEWRRGPRKERQASTEGKCYTSKHYITRA